MSTCTQCGTPIHDGWQCSPGCRRAMEARRSERERARRAGTPRAVSLLNRRTPRRVLDVLRAENARDYPADVLRPRTRGECADAPRPCPFISCKYHLYLDVSPRTGSVKVNFPHLDPWELTESCALDVADRGGTTLEDVGAIMNLTRERIRQLEVSAKSHLEESGDGLEEGTEDGDSNYREGWPW